MFRISKGLLAASLAAVVAFCTPQVARADLQIVLSQTGFADMVISVATVGGTGGLTAASPIVFGNFTITGLAASQLNANFANLQSTNLSITNNTGVAHSLTITTYGNNFTLPSGSNLQMTSSAGGNIFLPGSAANTNMTHQGWINNANTAVPASPIPMETSPGAQAANFNGLSFDNGTLSTLFNRLNPNYSLTTMATINVGGDAGIHFTETLQVLAVPAPAGIILAFTGLPCLAGAWLRRRKAVIE